MASGGNDLRKTQVALKPAWAPAGSGGNRVRREQAVPKPAWAPMGSENRLKWFHPAENAGCPETRLVGGGGLDGGDAGARASQLCLRP